MRSSDQARPAGRRAAGAAVALAMALTGCGSTVAVRSTVAGGAPAADGQLDGLSPSQNPADSPVGGAPGSAGGGPSGTTGTTTPGAAAAPGAPTASGAPSGVSGPTALPSTAAPTTQGGALVPSTLRIGLQYSSNANSTLGTFGGGEVSGDARLNAKAVMDYVNAHGGAGGRRMQALFNNVDATADGQTQSQAACAQWTQDDRISIALPSSATLDKDALRTCLGKAGVAAIYSNLFSTTTRQAFQSSPLWFENGTLSLDDYARTYVRGLVDQGFFSSGKVGVVYYAKAPFTDVFNRVLLPALREAGVKDPAKFGASISGVADLSGGTAQMSSAVLNFRSNGVTKVLFFEPWAGYFAFLQAAESQGYRPTYGFSSQQVPQVAAELGLIPAGQLAGSRLVGWIPLTELADITGKLGPRLALCTKIFKDAKVGISTDRTGYGVQMITCENLLILKDVYDRLPRQASGSDFTRGMEALGTSVQLVSRPRGRFGTDNHWGVSQYSPARYESGCSCYRYFGAAKEIR